MLVYILCWTKCAFQTSTLYRWFLAYLTSISTSLASARNCGLTQGDVRRLPCMTPDLTFLTSFFAIRFQSKKISSDQELLQSDPTSCPQNQREKTKYKNWQFTESMHGKPNEQLFPRQVVIQLPKNLLKYVTNIIGEPKYKYGQQEQVTVRNHNRSTALERSVIKNWGA